MSPTTHREEGARLAREELSDPVYGEAEPSLVQRLYRWFLDTLETLLEQAGQALPGGWWTLAPLLALLALLAAALVWYTRPARRSRRTAVLGTATELSAADHRERAERHAAAGDHAEAIRERTRAIDRGLEERALITPRPGRTATELAAEASAVLPEHRADLRRTAALFNDVHYGDRPADAEDYAVVRALDDALRTAAPEVSAEPTR